MRRSRRARRDRKNTAVLTSGRFASLFLVLWEQEEFTPVLVCTEGEGGRNDGGGGGRGSRATERKFCELKKKNNLVP